MAQWLERSALQLAAVLYAPWGVEIVHERTRPMTRDNMMYGAMSSPRLDVCAI